MSEFSLNYLALKLAANELFYTKDLLIIAVLCKTQSPELPYETFSYNPIKHFPEDEIFATPKMLGKL